MTLGSAHSTFPTMDPKLKEAKRQIELMRARAKQNANRLFSIPDGYSSGMAEELVDDIINCAILEIGVMQAEALQNANMCNPAHSNLPDQS